MKTLFVLAFIAFSVNVAWAANLTISVPDQVAADLAESWAASEGVTLTTAGQKRSYLEAKLKNFLKTEYKDRIDLPAREETLKSDSDAAVTTAFGG